MEKFEYYRQFEADRAELEQKEEWMSAMDLVSPLYFDADWGVKIIPPFRGALTRFYVTKGENKVSVYLDAWSRMGFMVNDEGDPIPYYEAWDFHRDPQRFLVNETEELMQYIREALGGETHV